MKNRSLVFNSAYKLALVEKDFSKNLEAHQVLVNIQATGICGTDIGIVAGRYPAAKPHVVLGHESSGIVVEIGKHVKNIKKGDRVFINPTFYCDQCLYCRTNRPNHCIEKTHTETGVTQDGTFSQYYITEERFLYLMSNKISFESASLAEPLSCVLTGVNQLNNVRMDARAIIFGGGPMGVLYAYALALNGLQGTIIEISNRRLQLLKSILPNNWNCAFSLSQAKKFNTGKTFDVIIDTTSRMLNTGLENLSRGGEILLVGLRDQCTEINPMHLADRSQRIIGSIDTIHTFNIACDLINTKRIPVKNLITHQYPLREFKKAFSKVGVDFSHQMIRPNASGLKVILLPEENIA